MTLDCGHEPTLPLGHAYTPGPGVRPESSRTWDCECGEGYTAHGIGTGYARTPDGRTLCYPCADEAQREDIEREPIVLAYVEPWGTPERVTTWTGATLARVVSVSRWRSWVHGMHRASMVAVRVVTPRGRVLTGRYNEDTGQAVGLRPVKPRPGEVITTTNGGTNA